MTVPPERVPSRSSRPLTMRSRTEQIFIDVFTRHPFAKLFSIILGYILVQLIDLQLRQSIFDQTLTVVTSASGSRDELILSLPPDYVLAPESKSVRPQLDVQIRGLAKERDFVRRPLRASLLAPRLRAVDQADDKTANILLEPSDLRLADLSKPDITISPVPLRIMRLESREIPLKARARAENEAFDLQVTFEPARLLVRGTAVAFRDVAELEIKVPDPASDVATSQIKIPLIELIEILEPRGLKLVEGQARVTATIVRRPKEEIELDVLNVPIHIAISANSPYSVKFPPPYDEGRLPKLTLLAGKSDAKEYRENPRLLESKLFVVAMVQKGVEENSQVLEVAKPEEGQNINVRVEVPEYLLKLYKLRMREGSLMLPVTIQKRN